MAAARAAALLAGAIACVLVFARSGPAGDAELGAGSGFSVESARAFDEFPLYFAGDRVDGLPVVAVLRRDDTADFVSFVYGDCEAAGDAGCAPPAEIQVWPACTRNLGLYQEALPGGPVPERVTLRGVPAGVFDDGKRLEIHTGRSSVVVFADSRERALRIAAALRPVNGPGLEGSPLPEPVPGAVEGTLDC